MRKIPSLFMRNYDGDRLVRDEVVPGCEWVLDGHGVATIKWDGTPIRLFHGLAYKRYDAKAGRSVPVDFAPAQDPDPVTGHWPGWVPITEGPEDRWLREAVAHTLELPDGTYEAIGPKIQGNPHRVVNHQLKRHGALVVTPDPPRTFKGLRQWFSENVCEGLVWHDGDQMVKLKTKDFGFKWAQQTGRAT